MTTTDNVNVVERMCFSVDFIREWLIEWNINRHKVKTDTSLLLKKANACDEDKGNFEKIVMP